MAKSGFMPGGLGVRCAECGLSTLLSGMYPQYAEGPHNPLHKVNCSQLLQIARGFPQALYLEYQALNPSSPMPEDL
jgi:hypothetical protein